MGTSLIFIVDLAFPVAGVAADDFPIFDAQLARGNPGDDGVELLGVAGGDEGRAVGGGEGQFWLTRGWHWRTIATPYECTTTNRACVSGVLGGGAGGGGVGDCEEFPVKAIGK